VEQLKWGEGKGEGTGRVGRRPVRGRELVLVLLR